MLLSHNNKFNQIGRSMAEMLSVLAVLGVLAVASLWGYRLLVNHHEANEILNNVRVATASVLQRGKVTTIDGKYIDIADFDKTISYPVNAFVYSETKEIGFYAIEVLEVPKEVCELALDKTQTAYKVIVNQKIPFDAKNVKICNNSDEQNTMWFLFDEIGLCETDCDNCCYGACCKASENCTDSVCCPTERQTIDAKCCPENLVATGTTCCTAFQAYFEGQERKCCLQKTCDGKCCGAKQECKADILKQGSNICCASDEFAMGGQCCPSDQYIDAQEGKLPKCCAWNEKAVNGECCLTESVYFIGEESFCCKDEGNKDKKTCNGECCGSNEFCQSIFENNHFVEIGCCPEVTENRTRCLSVPSTDENGCPVYVSACNADTETCLDGECCAKVQPNTAQCLTKKSALSNGCPTYVSACDADTETCVNGTCCAKVQPNTAQCLTKKSTLSNGCPTYVSACDASTQDCINGTCCAKVQPNTAQCLTKKSTLSNGCPTYVSACNPTTQICKNNQCISTCSSDAGYVKPSCAANLCCELSGPKDKCGNPTPVYGTLDKVYYTISQDGCAVQYTDGCSLTKYQYETKPKESCNGICSSGMCICRSNSDCSGNYFCDDPTNTTYYNVRDIGKCRPISTYSPKSVTADGLSWLISSEEMRSNAAERWCTKQGKSIVSLNTVDCTLDYTKKYCEDSSRLAKLSDAVSGAYSNVWTTSGSFDLFMKHLGSGKSFNHALCR